MKIFIGLFLEYKKAVVLSAVFMWLFSGVFSQTTVTVGAGTSNGTSYPLYAFNGYNYSQQLYLGTESGLAASYSNQYITAIRFYWSGSGDLANTDKWVVYLGNTSQSVFSTATSWIPLASLKQVYNGGVSLPAAAGWMTIVLDSAFQYTGQNIVVAIDENAPGNGSSFTNWQFSDPGAYRSIRYGSDATNPDPASPPAGSTSNTVRANIQFDFFNTANPVNVVSVSATLGVANRSYPNLKYAFDAVNSGGHKGDVVMAVGSTDNESMTVTSPLILNASGSGSASYSSVTICPAHSNITVTGNLASATIQLNLVRNVTIDGRIGSTGSTKNLTIENSNTSSSSKGAIEFYGASNDAIRYCTLKSATTSTSSGYGTVSMGYATNSGPSDNLIEYCAITKSGANLPMFAIASFNANSSYKSQNNTVRYCTISDFQRVGIWLGHTSVTDYNDGWTIDHNVFYESSTITINATNFYNYAIQVGYHDAGGFTFRQSGTHTVANNTIGGNGSGGKWTVTSTTGNSGLVVGGIFFAGGTVAYSEISGNEIKDFDITSWVNTNTTISGFNGIYAYHTKVKIGSSAGNSIHDVTLAHPSTWGGIISGVVLKNNANYNCEISNNQVYNMAATVKGPGASDMFHRFYGIYDWTESSVFDDVVNKNSVWNIDLMLNSDCYGINASGAITQNHVSKIKLGGTANTNLTGIYFFGTSTVNRPNFRVENNEVILGNDKDGNSTAVSRNIYGITMGGIGYAYYNSVLLQGTHTANNTDCLQLSTTSGPDFNAKNNLLYNGRTGGTGKHYCILATGANTIVSSNNAYIINSGAKANYYIGNWGGVDKSTLADWVAVSGETNSIAETTTNKPIATLFPVLDGLDKLKPADDSWLKAGVVLATTVDMDGVSRPKSGQTTVGAYEIGQVLPVELLTLKARNIGAVNIIEWQTATETNNDYFDVEKSTNAIEWVSAGRVKGAGNSSSKISYSFEDVSLNERSVYYRLKQVDYNGEYSYSSMVSVNREKAAVLLYLLYPVPAIDLVYVNYSGVGARLPVVKLYNALGVKVAELDPIRVDDGIIAIMLDEIPQGYYSLELDFGKEVKFLKLIIVKRGVLLK